MAKVKFYRGGEASSLPSTPQDGAIFIVERGDSGLGDIYVDISNAKRLHIVPDSELIKYNSETMSGQIVSTLGQAYIFQEKNKKGIAVGDGAAYISDLPVYSYVVADAIRNKVNAYLGTEYLNLDNTLLNKDIYEEKILSSGITNPTETLVLSRELWLDF